MAHDAMVRRLGENGAAIRRFVMDLIYPEGAVCRTCGRISGGDVLCPECAERLQRDGGLFAWARDDLEPDLPAYSLRLHDGIARQLILRLKHQAEACAARPLADLLIPLPDEPAFPPDTVVTWVTMPESRRRERFIDHGRILASATAEKLSLSCRQLIVRRETGERNQASLNRLDREKNLQHAFDPAERISFPVLLVDDVLTTGTTARRCADALRRGGAQRITVLTFTRASRSGL